MTNCIFKLDKEKVVNEKKIYHHICTVCGAVDIGPHETVVRECKPKEPSIVTKAANYTASTTKAVIAGFKVRTEEQIKEIFAICEACEFFKAKSEGRGVCLRCGCVLKDENSFFTNKISRATEHCPLDPPKW